MDADSGAPTPRTVLAVAGESYAIVAASTRMSTGFSILTRDSSKFAQMCVPALPCIKPSALTLVNLTSLQKSLYPVYITLS